MQPDALTVSAQHLAPFILLTYSLCICLEMLVAKAFDFKLYDFDDTLHNLLMFFVNRMMGGLGGAFMFAMLVCAGHFVPWKLSGIFGGVATFLIVDLLFFIQHRTFHTDTIFAPFHEVHHTSNQYNFTTTLRASVFLPLINPVFYLPAALLGCDPIAVIVCFSMIQVYQFFLHTQLVPSLGRLEGLINTPSAHRVHHGDQPSQYESNLGGILLVWDRLLGSYASEKSSLVYGLRDSKPEKNFFVAQAKPFVVCCRRLLKRVSGRTKLL